MQDSSSNESLSGLAFEDFITKIIQETKSVSQQINNFDIVKNLENDIDTLETAYTHFSRLTAKRKILSKGVEWFLDNFFILKKSAETIQKDLPESFFNQIPSLKNDKGVPRTYKLSEVMIFFFLYDLSENDINEFLENYQKVIDLQMGELWALAAFLRLVLIRSVGNAIMYLMKDDEKSENTFVSISSNVKPDEILARSIRTLLLLDRINWKRLFERHAKVEKILKSDPAGAYTNMDFNTRDRYRNVIDTLAKNSDYNEIEISHQVISIAKKHNQNNRKAHIGYYLIDNGKDEFESQIGYEPKSSEKIRRFIFRHNTFFYLGGIALLTLIVILGLIFISLWLGVSNWALLLFGLLGLIPASSVAVNLFNSFLTTLLPPTTLPKMDFDHRIPKEYRSVVAIPALLTNFDEIKFLTRQLELHYLGNKDKNLGFVLLSDYADAQMEVMPEDDELLRAAINEIILLNNKYQGDSGRKPFFIFHRRRQWNPNEDAWMGWERKRGKLADFNRFLLENYEESFDTIIGEKKYLSTVKYVITVDADTVLPRNSAIDLVATLAHPLNQAKFDHEKNKVVSGYTILQPRTEAKPTSVMKSTFSRIFAGDLGLDLYTRAVSDIYQDFFGEGSYVGKGIYDVKAFHQSLRNKVPNNSLLSHDLFEGIQGRAGLVSDIVLFEEYPPDYASQVNRLHRWVRGDWQLLPWLMPQVPMHDGSFTRNPLKIIDCWKIFDNLRRSLFAPFMFVSLLSGWFLISERTLIWSLVIIFISAFPIINHFLTVLSSRILIGAKIGFLGNFQTSFSRWLLWLVFLPYEALLMSDAIITTLTRIFISQKRLLQWQTSAHTIKLFGRQRKISTIWQRMIGAPILSLLIGTIFYLINPTGFWINLPLLVLWFLSPQIAYWVSLSLSHEKIKPLNKPSRKKIHSIARRTWLYFEHFVGPDEHWLPPDHYQEDPKGMVAHRTSPTNIGLMLLSTVAAHDFGYIGTLDYIYRITYTLDTLDEMEKYRGHLFNWYDTQNLETLSPKYISTVDSGNFVMSLIGLIHALEDILEETTCPETLFNGLIDTLQVFCEIIGSLENTPSRKTIRAINDAVQTIQEEMLENSSKSVQILDTLKDLEENLLELITNYIQNILDSDVYIEPTSMQDLRNWSDAIFIHLRNIRHQINQLSPWRKTWTNRPDWIETVENKKVKDFLNYFASTKLGALAIDQQPHVLETGIKQTEEIIRYLEEEGLEDLENTQINLLIEWFIDFLDDLKKTHQNILDMIGQIYDLIDRINLFIERMEFGFLFDRQREVFYLGYLVDAGKLDRNHYDLLASEARTASLYAISINAVPRTHWLHLNRPFTLINNIPTLLSWNGSMFEYLMPDLFTKTYPGTLLYQTNKGVVQAQIDYGKEKHVPWGISESSYYRFDQNDNYQYKGLGVPSLGRKRGLGDELVISPYASLMAIHVDPSSVLNNVSFLESEGALGHYGFYESIDYTTSRLPVGKNKAVIKSYMVHHHGMILAALGNFLNKNNIIKRVHRDPRIESSELLLQENIPQIKVIEKQQDSLVTDQKQDYEKISLTPWTIDTVPASKIVHILSNGNLHYHVTDSGSGYFSWENEIALTRWRPDKTLDNWGNWFYIQDLDTAETWSVGSQPIAGNDSSSKVIYSSHMVEFHKTFNEIQVVMQITISPNEDVCFHKIRVINQGSKNRRFRIVSYGEVVLAPQTTDWQHPAFNKLFIESKYDEDLNLLFFNRRKRSANEKELGLAHAVFCDAPGEVEFTSDRSTFIGRGLDTQIPVAISRNKPLSSIIGNTLDPIFALGKHISLNAEESVKLTFITTPKATLKNARRTAQKYQSSFRISNEFAASKSNSEKQLRAMNIDSDQLKTYQALLSNVLYPTPNLRGPLQDIKENKLGQSGLWAFGISGDYPILLVSIDSKDQIDEIQHIINAHSYWRKLGQMIDVVFLNTKDAGYTHELNDRLQQAINVMDSQTWVNRRGGLFVLTASQIDQLPLRLLNTVSSVYLDLKSMSIEQHLAKTKTIKLQLPHFNPPEPHQVLETKEELARPDDLLIDNGIGGFSTDGKEYQIFLKDYPQHQQTNGQIPPAPWVNVIANQDFGCLVSESGSGYTWAINSGENRLTPWMNDPVSDPSGEALYLRDELTGEIWSPTPKPAGEGVDYLVKHGQGYSTFESYHRGFKQKLQIFVDPNKPVKIIRLTLTNKTEINRRLTATYFAEWVLGARRDRIETFIVPGFDDQSGSIFARNTYSAEFSKRVAFLSSDQPVHGLTTDREEFLGTPGSRRQPASLLRVGLSNSVDPGVDPCAALQTHINLKPDEEITIAFTLGQGENEDNAKELASFFSEKDNIDKSWLESNENWDQILNTLQVNTPEQEMNIVLNGWLQYQNLSCRIWGRSGFFQSSGAYGFRDQLQDITAVLLAKPKTGRDHILRAARHQFEEGDVLHWWHPPSGRGVRTRITDDLLWLVYVTSEYIQKTGDTSILEEKIPFISGEPLEDEEEERYGPYESGKTGFSLFEHCRRALEHGDTQGPHGLPLIGGGDWNDGMNRVGIEGKGESVWLAWFLYENHLRFSKICEIMEETENADKHQQRAQELKERINETAWEDDRFLRGYFDNGDPLGSKNSDECQIDSLPQSWSILTQGTTKERQLKAIDAVETHLVQKEGRFIKLFTPPFNKTKNDPGYIKGYPPGVRENGGQYTHAAIWAVWALAKLGKGTKAHQQFGYLNPILHSRNLGEVNTYCVEPYVVAADIYSQPPFTGRGGWTWYTGSSGWLYRLGTEGLLGFNFYGDHFTIEPCIPSGWESYDMTYRKPNGPTYFIKVENANSVESGVISITLDGNELDDFKIPILDDKKEHQVIVVMG